MKIANSAARRKPSLIISTDTYVVDYLIRRHRVRRPLALLIAELAGLGARS